MEIIGFPKQKKYFNQLIKARSLGHAYLFIGSDMIGKKSFGLKLYEHLNPGVPPAHSDRDFKLILPLVEEGTKKEIPISTIRDLKIFLSFKPLYGKLKCAIIDDADLLSLEASQALLKILEEPPLHSLIILMTSKPQKLLTTISSRCESVYFFPQAESEVAEFLKSKKITKSDQEILKKLAQGRIGWLIKAMEENKISALEEEVMEFNKVLNKGSFEKIKFIQKIYERGDYQENIQNMIYWHYSELREDFKSTLLLKRLLQLNEILSKNEFNHRLALEKFILSID